MREGASLYRSRTAGNLRLLRWIMSDHPPGRVQMGT